MSRTPSRIPLVTDPAASPDAAALLERTRAALGRVPNLYAALANSPAALAGYLGFREALVHGLLPQPLREAIALLVAEDNACDYCVAAHTYRGARLGMTPDDLARARRADATDARTAAALAFVHTISRGRGPISDDQLARARATGWTDAELLEMIGHVALNVFSNYVNHVAAPPLDFPPAPPLDAPAR